MKQIILTLFLLCGMSIGSVAYLAAAAAREAWAQKAQAWAVFFTLMAGQFLVVLAGFWIVVMIQLGILK